MPEASTGPRLNRNALLSLTAGLGTVLAFCLGVAPIPFTDFICYSSSFLLGLTAVAAGFTALFQIQRSGEGGRPLAWIGISIGGASLLAVACTLLILALAYPSLERELQQVWAEFPH
jgi:hypothetical protein